MGICFLVETNLQAQDVSLSLHIDTAGTLSSKIDSTSKYVITDLTLTGELNGTDILFIREMSGWSAIGSSTGGKLSNLDLSEVHILAGGVAYFLNNHTETDAITESMFTGCRMLSSVIFPNSVKRIGGFAFASCRGLTTLTIPNSVTSIGEGAFSLCTKLTQFIIGSGNPSFCAIDGVLFNKDKTSLLKYPEGKTEKNYFVPYGVTSIGNAAFEYNDVLVSIELPNSVTTIGDGAFGACSELTSITIPDSVTTIGFSAFSQCFYLSSLRIGASVISIRGSAFSDCSGLNEVHCKMKLAPTISNIFYKVDKDSCKLFVPEGSFNSYKLAPIWSDFATIVEEGTAVPQTSANNATIYSVGNEIVIKGVKEGETVSVINVYGALVKKAKASGDELKVNVQANKLYLVKTTEKTFKVVL